METLPKHRSILGRESIEMSVACRSRVDRLTIDTSTNASVDVSVDALVDVSVEVRYKIHDPKRTCFYRQDLEQLGYHYRT